jgi:hypothetical protein
LLVVCESCDACHGRALAKSAHHNPARGYASLHLYNTHLSSPIRTHLSLTPMPPFTCLCLPSPVYASLHLYNTHFSRSLSTPPHPSPIQRTSLSRSLALSLPPPTLHLYNTHLSLAPMPPFTYITFLSLSLSLSLPPSPI